MTKPYIFFNVDTGENGYTVMIQVSKDKSGSHGPLQKFVFHSLSEVMHLVNDRLSGIEMTEVYRAPRSLVTGIPADIETPSGATC